VIQITDKEHSLPFSKGLLAQSITAAGVAPAAAYEIASTVASSLNARPDHAVTTDELRDLAAEGIRTRLGDIIAQRYLDLRSVTHLQQPLIILIGGTTGVGKSTLATEIGHRLGITRTISTDSIREVMRGIFNRDLMPPLYESAFEAWKGLRVPIPQGSNPVIVGFREQAAIVLSGVESIVQRAVKESYSIIIEGVHIAPGYLDPTKFEGARVVQFVVGVKQSDLHLSHFAMRETQTQGSRPQARYAIGFDDIRSLGAYIEDLAEERGVPIIDSRMLDTAVEDAMSLVVQAALDKNYCSYRIPQISGEFDLD